MLQRNPLAALRLTALAVVTATALTACGGDGGAITNPPIKSCQQDPTQAKCQQDTTHAAPTTLKSVAAASGRYFGAAIDASFESVNSARYDSVLAAEFNMLTPGNVMKWQTIHPSRATYNYKWADSMVAFAESHGMKVRGHTLVWHNQNPAWLNGGNWPADTLRAILVDHINNVVGHLKGHIYAWDVVNEAFDDGSGALRSTIWSQGLGASYIETAFRTARAADPSALLFYNDYNIETPGAKQDSVFALVSNLKAKGLIDGVGFQAHLLVNTGGSGAASQATYAASINRFAALGLKVELTELDVRVPTPGAGPTELAAQQAAFAAIVGACRAVPACDAIVVWGINDGESWIPGTFSGWGQALLFTDQFTHKDTYNAVLNALK